ncbi:MAG: HD domain-containing protein [Roseburia sp.]|nr:HD domain-containing protein [Anaeroplasma bactoclasticum]MCM1196986.1 HD domain-containing protein [Roseburia sp.]MCM1556529.1 HD domain-containing protein [Anaeroplasma bactoclasticum]
MKTKFKLPKEEQSFFFQTIKEIIYTNDFLKLKQYRHHGNISTYTHVIKVAYMSFRYAVKHYKKINKKELIRAALLHDLYFYDWHDKNNGVHLHGLFHPKKAVINAKSLYHITKREQRHMAHHMFPLTLIPPTTKEGWIICIFDKIAARSDYKAIKLKKKALKRASK